MTVALPTPRGPRVVPREATADPTDAPARLAVLTPTARDSAVAERVLVRAGFVVEVCPDMAALCKTINDDVGALLVAEEALTPPARAQFVAALETQPAWSDVPVILLTGESQLARSLSPTLQDVAAHTNVTLLERPVRVATLVTTLRSSLRARRRQFDVRDHLIERTQTEVALQAARGQAEDANRIKSEFLAVMSHELRTPLNAIGGYAELIEMGVRGPITESQRDDLRRIQQSQRHLLGLINQVLNYTRVDTGTVHYDITKVLVGDAIASAEGLIIPQLRAKDLTCTVGACDAAISVQADQDKLQQILLNLLTNAIKFTNPGGAIRIDCATRNDTVEISISDTGIGIAPEKLMTVFEPFVQVDAKFTRTHEGVGLGLAISRDLARGMHGELTVKSEVGVGSTFTLALPKG